jgi:hypothetical protein
MDDQKSDGLRLSSSLKARDLRLPILVLQFKEIQLVVIAGLTFRTSRT